MLVESDVIFAIVAECVEFYNEGAELRLNFLSGVGNVLRNLICLPRVVLFKRFFAGILWAISGG